MTVVSPGLGYQLQPKAPDVRRGALLIHGLTGAPTEMRLLAKHLVRNGFVVSVPLLPGHGGTVEDLLATGWRDWLVGISDAFDSLLAEVDEVHVAGICVGGLLALALARARPAVASVAAYSITLRHDGWAIPRWYALGQAIYPIFALPGLRRIGVREKEPFGIKNSRLRQHVAHALQERADGLLDVCPCGAIEQQYRLASHVMQIAPAIKQPVLLIQAEEDDQSRPRNAQRLHDRLGGPRALHWLRNSYHMIHLDAERAQVAGLTARFFQGEPAVPARSAPMRVRVFDSIAAIGRERWDMLFPLQLEAYDYLRVVETASLDGFQWRYLVAEQAGSVVAAVPAFLTEYALDTTLTGPAKRWLEGLRRLGLPLTARLACIGSPCTETALAGFAPTLPAGERAGLLALMLASWAELAAVDRCGIIAVKDLALPDEPLWTSALEAQRLHAMPSLACATLNISFKTIDGYLSQLSTATRRDMRRKLRGAGRVTVEVCHELNNDLLAEIMPIYAATRARAELAFEVLTPDYFAGVLRVMPGRARCMLYRVAGELMACNLLLHDGDLLLDKFFCMKPEGRAYDLYYLSWFENIRFCLEQGLSRYQSGQAAYANKLRLGSRLVPSKSWFRHRNAVVDPILREIAPWFAPADPSVAT